jgi:hypothetical protein
MTGASPAPAQAGGQTNQRSTRRSHLRRLTILATVLGILALAAVAYAASPLNTYTSKISFAAKAAGTAKKPVGVSFTQKYGAVGTSGNRSALLEDIKTTIYGLKSNLNLKAFQKCSPATILTSFASCPKGSEVASGSITAVVGSPTVFTPSDPSAFQCDPELHAWNSGSGHLTFFFVDTAAHACGPLMTGSTPPFTATVKQKGKNLVIDLPIPASITRPLGGSLAGSLETQTVTYLKLSHKAKGKTLYGLESVGCSKGKRPYSVAFTAALPNPSNSQTVTLKGSAPCK